MAVTPAWLSKAHTYRLLLLIPPVPGCNWCRGLTGPCRMQDVGKSKAVVAAERINSRVAGVCVTPHHARIEDMPLEFYQDFTVIILGLDSLEARRYMNSIACSLLGELLCTISWH